MRDRLRYALLIAAALSGVAIFLSFAFYEKPGLGLGHFFYVSIILVALAIGVIVNPQIPPSEVLTTSTGIRLVTYVTVGIVTGYFAKRNRPCSPSWGSSPIATP
jgi:multisubunit Na+/H+ antiporter MnhB subunit